ncbi:secretion protein F [Clostridioides sp. ZZV15-6598]|uniref:secretion protein F n=1 Tax=Clostridioides sp. ZZV15-6598 TaxID=2811501 RepID=UPI001C1D0007|nr:secretion protein F [Clostridioides sp. ZZV15-6598]HBF4081585.1 secretion protein F [Clostridioides difficile]
MILLLCFSLFVFSIYMILAGMLNMPGQKYSRTVSSIINSNKKKRTLDDLTTKIAMRISKFIKINEYKRKKLLLTLKSANINLTPETYVANAFVSSCVVLSLTIPTYVIYKKACIVWVALSIYSVFQELKRADRIVADKIKRIDYELPEFASTLALELSGTRDLSYIISEYVKTANETLAEELKFTLADMKSSSEKEALIRFESRVNSSNLSEVIVGLVGVLNGNDEIMYFQKLAGKLNDLKLQRVEAIASKRPSKIGKYTMLMLGCLIMNMFVALGIEVYKSLNNFF